jgi:hypothetical protein
LTPPNLTCKLIKENGPLVAGAVSNGLCSFENAVIVLPVTFVVLHKPFIDDALNGIIKISRRLVTPFWITFKKVAPVQYCLID